MIATYINSLAVVFGSLLGLLIGRRLKEQFKEVVFASAGLVTLVIGIQMALATRSFLVLLFSLVIGGIIGYGIGIEDGILWLGAWLERKTSRKSLTATTDTGGSLFARGFLNSSLLFCSGAMAVVGSIAAGTTGDYNLIFIKSIMDGCMAIILPPPMGQGDWIGCRHPCLSRVLYARWWLAVTFDGESGLAELSAAGGILLVMIAFGLIRVKEFKTGNFLPALVLAPIFAHFAALLAKLLPF